MTASQSDTPYLDALRAYAARRPARLHVPGHKGGPGADPGLTEAIGPQALALDIPALTWGIDVGDEPTPFTDALRLAAEAWGARRTWWLVNGASQGNHAALLALAHRGTEVVTQRNAHSSTIDALVAVGRGYGTLSEIALALKARKPVVGLDSWDIDGVDSAATPEQAVTAALAALT